MNNRQHFAILARAACVAVLAGFLSAACSSDSGTVAAAEGESIQDAAAPDDALLMFCGEARGALLELDWMLSGRKRLDVGTLGSDAFLVNQLAERVSAPPQVTNDINQWRQALDHWTTSLRALPPNIQDGRLIEPDTSGLDAKLTQELRPLGVRLSEWHAGICKT
jgi:hypothetical protein